MYTIRKTIFLNLLLFLVLYSCHSNKDVEAPDCIQTQIKTFAQEACGEGDRVREYLFQGQKVYVFEMGPCIADKTAEVVDANCRILGYLGGLLGLQEINGVNFEEEASFQRIVWEN